MSETLSLSDLTPDSKNARRHTERNVEMIADALREVGAARSIVVDEQGNILAGNATVKAAAEAGIEHVQVVDADGSTLVAVRRSGLSEAEKVRLALFDNRTAELADWDDERLAEILAEDEKLLNGLFKDDELAEVLGDLLKLEPAEDPGPQLDKAAELQQKWQTELGQVWEVGDHRIACGDCTDGAVVETVMRGDIADACITDPPYGMNWNADASRFSGGKFGSHPRGRERDDVINDDKPFDPSPYLNYPVVVLWGMNHFCDKLPPGGVLVWIKKPDERFGTFLSDCELAWTNVGHGVYAIRHEWGGITRESERGEFWHPTQKPVAVIGWTIEQTKAGPIVYDPFLGSGTCAVACQQLGRKCRGVEIEPKYVAVTLERLAGMGLEPRLIE